MPSCKDGSKNMTCLALSLTPVKKMCVCDAVKGDLNTGIMWNDNWKNITESVSVMKRSLCDVQAGWCLDAMFKMGLIDLVKRYAPLTARSLSLLCIAIDLERRRLDLAFMLQSVPGLKLTATPHHGSSLISYRAV